MNRATARAVAAIVVSAAWYVSPAPAEDSPTVNWPSFRGPGASGVAAGVRTPEKWNGETGENIRWKTPIPGLGLSSPVIWGDKLFITTAVNQVEPSELKVGLYGDPMPAKDDVEHSWRVLCIDKNTGAILWDREAYRGVPKIKRHPKGSHANPTAATDGVHVVAFFGSEGLYCYDFDGALKWKKDFGVLDAGAYNFRQAQWGFASSPIIHAGRVIVQCDSQDDPFVAALDVATGKEIWRTKRNDVCTFSTPTISKTADGTQVVLNGYREMAGYDFETGKQLWMIDDTGGDVPTPTPIVAGDLVFLANAHGPRGPIFAVKTDARGEISLPPDGEGNKHIAWWREKVGVYMQTLIVVGDFLYGCRDNGVLWCFHARSGHEVFKERLGTGSTGFTASPVAADGKLYFTSEEGDVHVVRAAPEFALIAKNPLGELCMASPAISDGAIYFRGSKHVIAVSSPPASR